MKTNKNIKALFTLSLFLAKYLWVYFIFLAIASLYDLNNYINATTQATLLILCFPLLIIKNLLHDREIKKMADDQIIHFLKNNICFPIFVSYRFKNEKDLITVRYKFCKLLKVVESKENLTNDYIVDDNFIIITYYKEEVNLNLTVKYEKI